jgi:hypothetical protein
MLRTLHYEPGFERVCHPANSAHHSPQPPRPVQTALRGIFGAILDGLAAYRHFKHLQARGIAHHTALRRALDIGAISG